MADLYVDIGAIRDLSSRQKHVATEFSDGNAHSDKIAAAVGHPRLHDTIHDFAHEWDDTREGMVSDIKALSQSAGVIADGFEQTDDGLAKALEQPASTGHAQPPVHGMGPVAQ